MPVLPYIVVQKSVRKLAGICVDCAYTQDSYKAVRCGNGNRKMLRTQCFTYISSLIFAACGLLLGGQVSWLFLRDSLKGN